MTQHERNELLLAHLPVVHFNAQKMAAKMPMIEYDDLYQAGFLGLEQAAHTFDPTRCKFGSYCASRVRGAMLDYVRGMDHLSRQHRKRVGDAGPKQQSINQCSREGKEYETLRAKVSRPDGTTELADLKRLLFKGMSRSERAAIMMYFFENLEMRLIGEALGLSESRISQMLKSVVARLRENKLLHQQLTAMVAVAA